MVDEVRPGAALLEIRRFRRKLDPELAKIMDRKSEALVSICVDDTPDRLAKRFTGQLVEPAIPLKDLPYPRALVQADYTLLLTRLDATLKEWGLQNWLAIVAPEVYEQIPQNFIQALNGLRIKPTPLGMAIRYVGSVK